MTFRRPTVWAWSLLFMMTIFTLPMGLNTVLAFLQDRAQGDIAPLFTPQVRHWETQISRWAQSSEIDPNLLATIMQIESCGHPDVISHAGAQGLFQVMPFHFTTGEEMLNPETNAQRSVNFIRECSQFADGDVGLILACYNGGPSVTWRPFNTWPQETRRYFIWGLGIYTDATRNATNSDILSQWLAAGGSNLCQRASMALGLS